MWLLIRTRPLPFGTHYSSHFKTHTAGPPITAQITITVALGKPATWVQRPPRAIPAAPKRFSLILREKHR
jgi:hypothetical protein